MKYFSKSDIKEMKESGYEKTTIDEARAIQEKADFLITQIKKAFKGVTLGDGVGLKEGQGLDDYQDKSVLRKLREQDEKLDWASIPVDDLNECYSSLSFFDAKGMRFHLPAFLIAQIRCEFNQELAFTLTYLNDYSRDQFKELSKEHKNVVVKVLEYMAADEDYDFDRSSILDAIEKYWSK